MKLQKSVAIYLAFALAFAHGTFMAVITWSDSPIVWKFMAVWFIVTSPAMLVLVLATAFDRPKSREEFKVDD